MSKPKWSELNDCCKVPANLVGWDCGCSIYAPCDVCWGTAQCKVCGHILDSKTEARIKEGPKEGVRAMSINEIYFSLDVEADGPIPGVNSLLSFGLAAFTEEGPVQFSEEAGPVTFGAHLYFLKGAVQDLDTMEWWRKQGDAYEKTRTNLMTPENAMKEAISWIEGWAKKLNRKPVCVAFPASYDFMWWHWYALRFAGRDPFGFQAFDCKTAAAITLGIGFREAAKKNFPKAWWASGQHTSLRHDHDAVNDAIEQGHMFVGIMKEAVDQRMGLRCALILAEKALAASYKERVPLLTEMIVELKRAMRKE